MLGLATPPHLLDISGRIDNPGAINSFAVLPPGLATGAPLVVLLHGCTQNAALIANGTGWGALAETAGFALLLPQQTEAKNPRRCFNWFLPTETARGQGEAWLKMLPKPKRLTERTVVTDIWNHPLPVVILLGCLCAEWWLRRRRGLA